MAIFSKINKQTGEVALRYIVYEGDNSKLYDEVDTFDMTDCCCLRTWDFRHYVQIFGGVSYLVIIHEDMTVLDFCTKLDMGNAIMPFYFVAGEYPDFDKSRTYTPEDLEALYPSALYDTVEVDDVRDR